MSQLFKTIAAAAIVGTMGIASQAVAAPVVVNLACTGFSGPTELANNITCPTYNSLSFGAPLLSMSLELTGRITGDIDLTNNATTAQNVSGTTNSSFFAGALTGFTFASPLFNPSFSTGFNVIGAGATVSFLGLDSGTVSTGFQGVNPGDLGLYSTAGAGNFLIGITTISGFTVTGGGGQIGSDQDTFGIANANVRYTYDDGTVLTPEPATIAVLGMGMLALGAYRRRRQG